MDKLKNAMMQGYDPDKERKYQEQQDLMYKKYAKSINGLATFNQVETYIGFDMLVSNARALIRGDLDEIKKGGGRIDFNELIKDVKFLDSFVQKQK